jgi:DNA polymerase-4
LAERGIQTIGQLAASPDGALQTLLGRALGGKVRALAANDDQRRVQPQGRAGSVGAQSGFGKRDVSPKLIRSVLGHLADRVAGRLRAKHRAGRTITVRVRFANMKAVTRSHTGPNPISATLTLTEIAERLVYKALADHSDQYQISLLAISVSNLVDQPVLQLELPVLPDEAERPGSRLGSARWAVDHSVDAVRRRFGRSAVGYAGVVLSEHVSVPDEFRELAEHEL